MTKTSKSEEVKEDSYNLKRSPTMIIFAYIN